MLSILIIIPILSSLIISLFNLSLNKKKYLSLFTSLIILYFSLWTLLKYNNGNGEYQFREIINLYYYKIQLGIDGTTLSLIILTNIIFPIIFLLIPKDIKNNENLIFILFLSIQSLLIIIFSSLDLLIFYISFELILIPLFLLIGLLSLREKEKIEAGYRLFIYTLLGGLLMLISIIIISKKYGTTSNELLLLKLNENENINWFIWISLFITFAIKIPLMPLHSWLPLRTYRSKYGCKYNISKFNIKNGRYRINKI